MKCQNCGGEMDSREVRCPYCHSENKEGILFQEEIQKKLERYKFLKPFILKKKTPEMVSKYMNRILLILLLINISLWVAGFAIFCLGEENIKDPKPKEGTYAAKFEDFDRGEFYIAMNNILEAGQKGELPDDYDVEKVIESGFRILDEVDEEEQEYIYFFWTNYLGMTEDELAYLEEVKQDDSVYYLENIWLYNTVDRIKAELEGRIK